MLTGQVTVTAFIVPPKSNVSQRIYACDAIIPYCPNPLAAHNCVSFFIIQPPTHFYRYNPHHWSLSDLLNSVLSVKKIETIVTTPSQWPCICLSSLTKLVFCPITLLFRFFSNGNYTLKIIPQQSNTWSIL